MSTAPTALIEPEVHLARLKDFQRRTVDYLFQRMYADPKPALRFLVADEVGLGKTMVARGLIAKAIQQLDALGVQRIDVVYVCSNAAIAAQNLARLDVTADADGDHKRTNFATRLTLLPLHVSGLNDNRVNFISFTPGTTFNLRSRGGVVQERALLYYILRKLPGLRRDGLKRMLRDRAGWNTWNWYRTAWRRDPKAVPDADIVTRMREAVLADTKLYERLRAVVDEWVGRSDEDSVDWPLVNRRLALIGDLRIKLSGLCLDALEPDLIILDEFQRFKDLLQDDGSEQSALARRLFDYPGHEDDPPPRVLLLSATPYKMYTVAGEVADDHYKDLLQTLSFLHHDDQEQVSQVKAGLRWYRECLTRTVSMLRAPGTDTTPVEQALIAARDAVQADLHRVMVRTERVASSTHRDAMVHEVLSKPAPHTADLLQAVAIDRVAQAVGARDIIEYWKSAPYLLSFMKGYDLKRRLDSHVQGHKEAKPGSDAMCSAVSDARPHMLIPDHLDAYGQVDPANARLRRLVDDLFTDELWRLLWLPGSVSYMEPAPQYARAARASKALVFSAWNVVPDAIAAVTSYLAEREMVHTRAPQQRYRSLSKDRRGLLRYSVSGERYAGMGALLMQYPSPALAALGDPLVLARTAGAPLSQADAIRRVATAIQAQLDNLQVPLDEERRGRDVRWYWVAVAMLDAHNHPDVLLWLHDTDESGFLAIGRRGKHHGRDGDETSGFAQVVARFVDAAGVPTALGRPPDDLAEVLARVALGAPAVCALRALRRQRPELPLTDGGLLHAAAEVGDSFRTLFNLPETQGLLGAFDRHRAADDDEEDSDYWLRCVQHGLDGNLQAVLDEHVHVLRDGLGLGDEAKADQVVGGISSALADALSIRTANLTIDDLDAAGPASPGWLTRSQDRFSFRTRFGLRLGELRDENKQVHRIDVVRKAFNSPFRPFVLASTSVGQEGLDFHTWCHVVYHWNLPTNPVDMEQREGRVHRYKGLAVRRNVALRYASGVLGGAWDGGGDPWAWMFEQARLARPPECSDLVPYWLFDDVPDGQAMKVERRVPIVPLSKEASRYQALKRSLVYYRLAFGQPRQDDLVHWLQQVLGDEAVQLVEDWRIDLRAPAID